jgi:hypothetical protein
MTANEMFEKLGYKLINDKNIVYKGTHFTGRIIHIAFFSDKKILITQSIGIEELQAINKQVEELGWNKEEK